jgi:hypothetical protein
MLIALLERSLWQGVEVVRQCCSSSPTVNISCAVAGCPSSD